MGWHGGKGKRGDCSDFTACCFPDLYHCNYQYGVMFGLKEDSKSRLHIPTAVLKVLLKLNKDLANRVTAREERS